MTPDSYEEDEGPGLLLSPWFYFGGIACLAVFCAVVVIA